MLPAPRYYLSLLPLLFLIVACRPSPQYQQHYNVPGAAWDQQTFRPSFTFTITDTSAAYQLLLLIRHGDNYPFSNIWLLAETKRPGDSAFQEIRVEVPLAEPSGQWRGRGMGAIWEQRVPVAMTVPGEPPFFNRKGSYTIRFAQDMRLNPLPDVIQIGLRLERKPTLAEMQHMRRANPQG